MLKLLWNLSGKFDSLWVKWVHTYYFKHCDFMTAIPTSYQSWIMKKIMTSRDNICTVQHIWDEKLAKDKFSMKSMYMLIRYDVPKVSWYQLLRGNGARPRAAMTLWLACHG
ncbi:unnamed protein product [Lathyrus sativus]|nr:unnamed protein product [Lathyrus sativus]